MLHQTKFLLKVKAEETLNREVLWLRVVTSVVTLLASVTDLVMHIYVYNLCNYLRLPAMQSYFTKLYLCK